MSVSDFVQLQDSNMTMFEYSEHWIAPESMHTSAGSVKIA